MYNMYINFYNINVYFVAGSDIFQTGRSQGMSKKT